MYDYVTTCIHVIALFVDTVEYMMRYLYIYVITLFVDVPPLLLQSERPAVQEEVLPAGARHGLPACPAGLLPDGPGCCGQEGNRGFLKQHLNQCSGVI